MFVDGGALLNVMPLATMINIGKNAEDLIPTNMTMTSLMGHASHALSVLTTDVTFGSKVPRSAFFVREGKSSYALIFGRDSIHTSECASSTLHQKVMILISDKVKISESDQIQHTDQWNRGEELEDQI